MCVYAHTCAHIPAYMTHTHTYIHTYLLMLAMWNHGDCHLRDILGFRFFIFSKKTKTCKSLFLCMLAMCTCVYMHMPVHTFLHTYTHMSVLHVFVCFICDAKNTHLYNIAWVFVFTVFMLANVCICTYLCTHSCIYATHLHTYLLMLAMWNHVDCHFGNILGFRIVIFKKTKTRK